MLCSVIVYTGLTCLHFFSYSASNPSYSLAFVSFFSNFFLVPISFLSLRLPLSIFLSQVWKASLLLSDYLLHHGSELLRDTAVLELGCGAGLCGVVAAAFASWVCCTGEVQYASSNLAVYETIVPVLVYYLSLNPKYIALAIISNSFAFTDGVIVQRLLWRRILVHFSSKVPPLDIDFGAYCRVS